jgi:concanavalin A-like lectin/glucanase superfamily protein/Ig-like domain-containing protein
MKQRTLHISFVLLLSLSVAVQGQSVMVNRYSFDTGATTAVDSITGMDGTLEEGASIGSNALQLDGENDYVNLPSRIMDYSPDGYTSMTIEAWFTIDTVQNWQRLFDFGETGGDGDWGGNCLFYTPSNGTEQRFRICGPPPGYNREDGPIAAQVSTGVEIHVACVYDAETDPDTMSIYNNGAFMNSATVVSDNAILGLSGMARVFAYIGNATYESDDELDGSVNEFRIYDGALTGPEIMASYLAGPDIVVKTASNPSPGQHDDLVSVAPPLGWDGPAGASNTYDVWRSMTPTDPNLVQVAAGIGVTSYPLAGLANEATYYWRIDSHIGTDPNTYKGPIWDFLTAPLKPVIQIQPAETGGVVDTEVSLTVVALNPNVGDSSGLDYEWYKGQPGDTSTPVGINDAALTFPSVQVSDAGDYYCRVLIADDHDIYTDSDSATLRVITESLIHRYSFTDSENSPSHIHDSVGSAHGTMGASGIAVTGDTLVLSGSDPNGFVVLPGGMVSGLWDCTLVFWLQIPTHTFDWRYAASFGNTLGDGMGYAYLALMTSSGYSDTRAVLTDAQWGGEQMSTIPGGMPANTVVNYAVVLDRTNGQIRQYVDGQPAGDIATLTHNLSVIGTDHSYVGKSVFDPDPPFAGTIDELRFYDFAMDEEWIIEAYKRGADDINLDPCVARPTADFVRDCVVDLKDFAKFASEWLACGLLSCQ